MYHSAPVIDNSRFAPEETMIVAVRSAGVSFRGANLRGAVLTGSDKHCAILWETDIARAVMPNPADVRNPDDDGSAELASVYRAYA